MESRCGRQGRRGEHSRRGGRGRAVVNGVDAVDGIARRCRADMSVSDYTIPVLALHGVVGG
jgi:hypothetical protein